MATQRLSRLHKRIVQWLAADHQRTKGGILSRHEELVKTLQRDKGTISRSRRLLEVRGWIVIGRSPGGKAHHLALTPEGHKRAAEVTKSWHEETIDKQWVTGSMRISPPSHFTDR